MCQLAFYIFFCRQCTTVRSYEKNADYRTSFGKKIILDCLHPVFISHVFICLKALLGIATKTSAAIHINKLPAMLDGTMQCMIEYCPRKVGNYVCDVILGMLFVSFNVY